MRRGVSPTLATTCPVSPSTRSGSSRATYPSGQTSETTPSLAVWTPGDLPLQRLVEVQAGAAPAGGCRVQRQRPRGTARYQQGEEAGGGWSVHDGETTEVTWKWAWMLFHFSPYMVDPEAPMWMPRG